MEDEVELLRARLRADTLTPERLHVAALAEHPAALALAEELPLVRPLKEIAAVFKLGPRPRSAPRPWGARSRP